MSIRLFCCFHRHLPEQAFVDISPQELKKYVTFYGVRDKDTSSLTSYQTYIYEYDLIDYRPLLQQNKYNEASCIYHVFANKLYIKYDYVGFCQYDMHFSPTLFKNVEKQISITPNTIFYQTFIPWAFYGGQLAIIQDYPPHIQAGLTRYNDMFHTNYTKDVLLANQMLCCNTFIVPKAMYEKLMSWLTAYYVDTICDCIAGTDFNAGHMIEGLTGMFFALQISEGAMYYPLELEHGSDYSLRTTDYIV